MRSAAYGLAGSSVGFLVGGILMGRAAGKTHEALETQQDRFGSVDADMVDRGKSQQLGANILYGASIATLGAGVGLYLADTLGSGGSDESEEDIPPSEDTDDDASVDMLGAR